jgi:hypothetical protein
VAKAKAENPFGDAEGGTPMLRRLMDRFRRRPEAIPTDAPAPRDYAQEREDHRSAQMSGEDKAWGEASRQRDRENRARDQTPPTR